MPHTRIPPPGQHQRVSLLHRRRAAVLLHHPPRRGRRGHPGAEGAPVLPQAAAKFGGAPVGIAFFDLCWRKKQCGAWAGQIFGAAQLADMRAANGAAVGQLAEAAVDGQAQRTVAGSTAAPNAPNAPNPP